MANNTITFQIPRWAGSLGRLLALLSIGYGVLVFIFEPRLDNKINQAVLAESDVVAGKLTEIEAAIQDQLNMAIAKENVKFSDVRASVGQIEGYVSSLRQDMAAIKTDSQNTKASVKRVEQLLDQFIMSADK